MFYPNIYAHAVCDLIDQDVASPKEVFDFVENFCRDDKNINLEKELGNFIAMRQFFKNQRMG